MFLSSKNLKSSKVSCWNVLVFFLCFWLLFLIFSCCSFVFCCLLAASVGRLLQGEEALEWLLTECHGDGMRPEARLLVAGDLT